jgi:uncharacterized protein with NRDE domain
LLFSAFPQQQQQQQQHAMCIAFFCFDYHGDLPLVLASNRDEFLKRPTAPLRRWVPTTKEDGSNSRHAILAGQDEHEGGTWLAVRPDGDHRLALVTNYREGVSANGETNPTSPNDDELPHPPPSRGKLITDFCTTDVSITDFTAHLEEEGHLYAGFNLLFGSHTDGFYFYSNRSPSASSCRVQPLLPGVLYGICNGYLDEAWPKLKRGKEKVGQVLEDAGTTQQESDIVGEDAARGLISRVQSGLWKVLTDDWKPLNDADLPETGVGLDIERLLSSIFVEGRAFGYGTRCSTLVLQSRDKGWRMEERSYCQEDSSKPDDLLDPTSDYKSQVFEWS